MQATRARQETITLARLYRKYILLGAVEKGTLIICDEIGLASTTDFQQILLPLKKLGCLLWLLGDPQSQMLPVSDEWLGNNIASDISDSAMLKSSVDCTRCVFTEPKRCDKKLFTWVSSIGAGGIRTQLPFPTLLEQARLAFPATGRPPTLSESV